MVTFTHSQQGTSPANWQSALALDEVAPLDLSELRRLVVVAAHPDDETLGAAGLMALAEAADARVEVIVATNGEASHPGSPTHSPTALARIRQREVTAAVHRVAPHASIHLLHLPDGRLADHLIGLTEEIRFHLGCPWATGTVVVSPWPGDGHPDHQAAGTAAAQAAHHRGARVLHYPIWAWHWARPADNVLPRPDLLRLPLPPQAHRAKQDALRLHRSQVAALSGAPGDEPVVPPGFRQHFERGFEIFISETSAEAVVPPSVLGPSDRVAGSLPGSFFDDFYAAGDDPWGFETRWYEKRKRDLTLAILPRQRFNSGYEPGCSIGVLTAELADRCDELVASDVALQPLEAAGRRLAGRTHVRLEQRAFPADWPDEQFDLIVLSEIGYYCDHADLHVLVERATRSLTADGVLVACHWRHPVAEYPLSGDEVHAELRSRDDLALLASHLEQDFRLEVFVRPPAISVAARSGLI